MASDHRMRLTTYQHWQAGTCNAILPNNFPHQQVTLNQSLGMKLAHMACMFPHGQGRQAKCKVGRGMQNALKRLIEKRNA